MNPYIFIYSYDFKKLKTQHNTRLQAVLIIDLTNETKQTERKNENFLNFSIFTIYLILSTMMAVYIFLPTI